MIKLFGERKIDEAFNMILKKVTHRISNLSDNQILNGDLNQIAKETATTLQLKELDIDLEKRDVNIVMTDVPGNRFPFEYDVDRNKFYPCAKVNYTFVVKSGDIDLLSVYTRSSALNRNIIAEVINNRFTIGYQTLSGNKDLSEKVKEEVKQGIREILSPIRNVIDRINIEVQEFNWKLENYVLSELENKRRDLQNMNDQKNDLNRL